MGNATNSNQLCGVSTFTLPFVCVCVCVCVFNYLQQIAKLLVRANVPCLSSPSYTVSFLFQFFEVT